MGSRSRQSVDGAEEDDIEINMDDNDEDLFNYSARRRPDSGNSELRSRPGTGVSHASLFSASRVSNSSLEYPGNQPRDNLLLCPSLFMDKTFNQNLLKKVLGPWINLGEIALDPVGQFQIKVLLFSSGVFSAAKI